MECNVGNNVWFVETCTSFGWEPSGSRFGAVMSSDPNPKNMAPGVVLKTNVEFYHLDPKKGDFKLMRECGDEAGFV